MGEPWESDTLPEAAISLTCKSGKGYDADMLTIRGMDVAEFRANADALLGEEIVNQKLTQLRTVPQDDGQGGSPSPAANNNGGGGGNGGGWKDNPPTCKHGQMQAREWTAKSGPKAGQAQHTFFCPQPREATDKCKPIDAVTRKEWGS